VFVWGGTHRFEALELEGRFFINPGSATGAITSGYWAEGYYLPFFSFELSLTGFREDPVPSFMLMDVQGMSLVLYIYTLDNGQIKVEKVLLEFGRIPNCSCRIERESHDGISPF
jgi:vacuolar protein sorting-associated protein 29